MRTPLPCLCNAGLRAPHPQGYPRSDIDVLAVRTDRNRIACLSNDHKALSSQIEGLLKQLHALTRCVGQREVRRCRCHLTPCLATASSTAS